MMGSTTPVVPKVDLQKFINSPLIEYQLPNPAGWVQRRQGKLLVGEDADSCQVVGEGGNFWWKRTQVHLLSAHIPVDKIVNAVTVNVVTVCD